MPTIALQPFPTCWSAIVFLDDGADKIAKLPTFYSNAAASMNFRGSLNWFVPFKQAGQSPDWTFDALPATDISIISPDGSGNIFIGSQITSRYQSPGSATWAVTYEFDSAPPPEKGVSDWLGINLNFSAGYPAVGLEISRFWDKKNALIESTGIRYTSAWRQDFPAFYWMGQDVAGSDLSTWPGTWTGYGWVPWGGQLPFPTWRIVQGSTPQAPPVLTRWGGYSWMSDSGPQGNAAVGLPWPPNGAATFGLGIYRNAKFGSGLLEFPNKDWALGSVGHGTTGTDDLLWITSLYEFNPAIVSNAAYCPTGSNWSGNRSAWPNPGWIPRTVNPLDGGSSILATNYPAYLPFAVPAGRVSLGETNGIQTGFPGIDPSTPWVALWSNANNIDPNNSVGLQFFGIDCAAGKLPPLANRTGRSWTWTDQRANANNYYRQPSLISLGLGYTLSYLGARWLAPST